MFLFVLLTAIALSWVAARMQQARRQRAAVDALVKRKWVVYYDWDIAPDDDDPLTFTSDELRFLVDGPYQPPGPPWLRRLLGDDFFTDVVIAYQGSPNVRDADLEHIERFTRLQGLRLWGTTPGVTETGVKELQKALPTCAVVLIEKERIGLDFSFESDEADPP